jgi:SAM-dependent methyltransferase
MTNHSFGSYEELAQEYYDASRHPTCANFREASAILFRKWSSLMGPVQGLSCEVGPGRSLLTELITRGELSYRRILLVDSSSSMLAHSRVFSLPGVQSIVGAASMLPLRRSSIDFLASSLGDPYNILEFWREAYRVLKPGGTILFTTPSHEWAAAFRKGLSVELKTKAEFVLRDGRKLYVPSFILPGEEQLKLMASCNFQLVDRSSVRISDLGDSPLSPKLLVKDSKELVIVTGYICRKRIGTEK